MYRTEGDIAKAAEISAEQAACLIAEVINPDLDDKTIRFGVNMCVKQLLAEKRERDLKASKPPDSSESVNTTIESIPLHKTHAHPSSPSTVTSSADQQSTPGNSTPQYLVLKAQLKQVVESQQMLNNMMVEMRFATNQLSFRAARRRPSRRSVTFQHPNCSSRALAVSVARRPSRFYVFQARIVSQSMEEAVTAATTP